MRTQRDGDFSSTYAAPNQPIQIYDPFSTRADPAKPGSYLRTPFSSGALASRTADA